MVRTRTRRVERHRIRDSRRADRRGGLLGKVVIDRMVLLVEDSRSLAMKLASLLVERWGCDVHVAENIAEAKKLLEKHGWDYVSAVCDVNLPDATNGEIIDLLRELAIPTIAMTDRLDERLREMVVKKGVADYVLKDGDIQYEYIVQLVGRLYKNLTIKALVVSDSLHTRMVLEQMLRTQCLQTLGASDGNAALKLLGEHPEIHLVLVDYPKPEPVITDYPIAELPNMDSFTFTQEARKLRGKERLAIVGLSASADVSVAARLLKYGANEFIFKPFSYEELACRVVQNLEMMEQMETIREVANRDFLTGLHNRRYFFERGQEVYLTALREGQPLAIAMVDIDNFKALNDTFGHDVGDCVLKHCSRLLMQNFGAELLCRLGGEEFAILLSRASLVEVRERFENFVSKVAVTPTVYEGKSIPFTVSAGISNQLGKDLNEMLKLADDRLYQAKEAGRNRVESG